MNTGLKSFFFAALIVLFLSSRAAGHGGGGPHVGGGGGFHGGGGAEFRGGERESFGRGGEGEFRGGERESFGRGGEGEFRGERVGEGGTNRALDNHSREINPPRPNIYDRPYPGLHPAPNPNPGPRPGPGPHPTPGPHPGPGPDPHPGPHSLPGPNPHPGPHPGPWPDHNPNWYHGNWPNNWHHGWNGWNNWNGPAAWGAGFATGVAAATPWSWGYWPYVNPYRPTPLVVGSVTIDYSEPIVLASPPVTVVQAAPQSAGAPPTANPPTQADQAMERLDAGRAAFARGDFSGALAECNQAVARQPNSAAAHEFRGLALFALHQYKEAAGPVYAVLSVGPGWDWATLSSLYPQPDVYAGQLRALEQYVASNRDVAEARFLLAYHYMTGGHNDAAAAQFKAAAELNPQDRLSAQLAAAMTPTTVRQPPAPSPAATNAKPISASALAGVWESTRADGTTITLSLGPDAKYTWKLAQKDKPRAFSGAYTVADNLLILKDGDNPVMVGQVKLLSDNRFNFKLAGDNPNDPGLTFGK